jgi:hypothetical protein
VTEIGKTPTGNLEDPSALHIAVWDSLTTWERAAQYEKNSPETHKVMIQLLREEMKHRHRLDYIDTARQWLGVVLGFGTVVVLAGVAWHYADLHQAIPGATFAGAGMVATVAIFVTGRHMGRQRMGRQ